MRGRGGGREGGRDNVSPPLQFDYLTITVKLKQCDARSFCERDQMKRNRVKGRERGEGRGGREKEVLNERMVRIPHREERNVWRRFTDQRRNRRHFQVSFD